MQFTQKSQSFIRYVVRSVDLCVRIERRINTIN